MKSKHSLSNIERLNRRIAVWLAIATGLLGAAVGGLPDLFGGSFHDSDFVPRLATSGITAVLGLLALWAANRTWRRRLEILHDRGTLYVVDSPMEGWTPDEKESYLATAKSQFADFLHVPGPTGLTRWRWPLEGPRAQRWSAAVDDLVYSFRSVLRNDDPVTPNSVVCWAAYPVAMAWAARVCASDRRMTLAVRQRPSYGRQLRFGGPRWSQNAHTFEEPVTPVAVTHVPDVSRARIEFGGQPASPDEAAVAPTARLLLVRTNWQDWGRWGLTTQAGDDASVLRVRNASGEDWPTALDLEVHEWTYLPPEAGGHAWQSFPAMAASIADWIVATADPEGLNFLAALLPPEIPLGVGIQAVRRIQPKAWPAQLWPIVKLGDQAPMVAPGLNLGRDSLHTKYLEGPR